MPHFVIKLDCKENAVSFCQSLSRNNIIGININIIILLKKCTFTIIASHWYVGATKFSLPLGITTYVAADIAPKHTFITFAIVNSSLMLFILFLFYNLLLHAFACGNKICCNYYLSLHVERGVHIYYGK